MEKVGVYHQCGHNEKWNIESFLYDKVGNGMIISPVNMKKEKIVALEKDVKQNCFFDPQFYLPKSINEKLNAYEFFPNNISDGYVTVDYDEFAYKSAKLCIDFQMKNGFKYIIIPCVYFEDLTINYLDTQRELYINPFLEELNKINNKKPVLLSVIIKDIQLKDDDYKYDLLNFITSFSGIDGIYLIPQHKETYKRVRDIEYIYNLMVFIDILRNNSLFVHVGYVDIEGYLLTLAGVNSLSIGAYENVRGFAIDKFSGEKSSKRQGPTPRIYSSKLFQWIDFNYLTAMKRLYPGYENLFDDTPYKVIMFQPEFNWHFTKPEIYKHYFISYGNQIKSLPSEYNNRYNSIVSNIESAMRYFTDIQNKRIYLNDNSNGEHLSLWLTAINMFDNYKKGGV